MWQALVRMTDRLLHDANRVWLREKAAVAPTRRPLASQSQYQPLRHVTLTDEVARTLFEEYAAHRKGPRGHEETGWVLLGLRETEDAVALATLPAGAERDAGVAHVQFNSSAQAVGSRIVRQWDRRMSILGLVHTHPGTLRHPSDGDYRGDSRWVGQLRGGEGVFGIGTVMGPAQDGALFARQPAPHVQCWDDLCLSWYSLRDGDSDYHPLPCRITLGPDLACPLRKIWPTIETFAESLDRLCQQQNGVAFETVAGKQGTALLVNIPLAEADEAILVLLEGKEVRYYLTRGSEMFEIDAPDERLDRGVYLLLAKLAERSLRHPEELANNIS